MLVVLSGLPGTGKSTIGKALAAKLSAAYIRVDEIEHALKQQMGFDQEIGAAGYSVAIAIAASNLKLGNLVVADSVNPIPESRQAWRNAVQATGGKRLIEVEVVCSDEAEHRRRVEERVADIDGFTPPSWLSVKSHKYVPWTEPRLTIDTAVISVIDAVSIIEEQIQAMSAGA